MKATLLATLLTITISTAVYSQGKSVIFSAVKLNDSTTLVRYLRVGSKANTTGMYGCTLLMEASRNGSHAAAKVLLAHGAKVNATDEMGSTALMEAALKGDVIMSTLLLQAGANTSMVDKAGQTALDIANDFKQLGVVQLLTEYANNNTKYNYATHRK